MKWLAGIAAVGHAIVAGAEKFTSSTGGQTVATDFTKTFDDAKKAALGYVQQGLTSQATSEMTKGLTALGVPSTIAGVMASAAIAQGEGLLASV